MEIRQLQYFVAIVREGSFSRAARTLHIGQPALSKQIQSLEHELGVELLVRVPEGIRTTEAGARLDEMSRSLLGYVEDIRQSVRKAGSELIGTVTVGISPSLVPAVAGHLTTTLAQQHPKLRLRIVEGLPMFLAEWLDLGRLDVGLFTQWPLEDGGTRLEFDTIGSDEVVLVGKRDLMPSDAGESVRAADLRPLRMALTPGFRQVLAGGLGVDPSSELLGLEIDSVHMVKDLVLGGEYCSALPYTFVRDDLRDGDLVAVSFDPGVRRRLVAATRPGRRRQGPIDAVIHAVRHRLTEITTSDGSPRYGQ